MHQQRDRAVLLAFPERERKAPRRIVLEPPADLVLGPAAVEIAHDEPGERAVPEHVDVAVLDRERLVEALHRARIIAHAVQQKPEIVQRLGPRRLELERPLEGRRRLLEAQHLPEHIAEVRIDRGVGLADGERAAEAGSGRRQLLLRAQDHADVVVGVGELRIKLEGAHVELHRAIVVASLVPLGGSQEGLLGVLGYRRVGRLNRGRRRLRLRSLSRRCGVA
jgi:hypothetical protein